MKTRTIKFLITMLLGIGVFFAQSCKKTNPPVVDFFFEVNGYTVTFTSQATNTTSYLWDFGDGESSTETNPVHTYAKSGDYDVILTAKGDGGESTQTKTVTIQPSAYEMLTDGPDAADGKTWKISRTATTGDGVFIPIDTIFGIPWLYLPDNALDDYLSLGEEYDDEFTFKFDKTYRHDVKNGAGMTGWLYASNNNLEAVTTTEYGIWTTKFTPPENATFTFAKDTTFTLQCNMEKKDSTYAVTFKHAMVVVPSEPEFFILRDYTRIAVIRDISPDKMRVAVFLSSEDGAPGTLPTHAILLTLEPKK